MKKSSKFKLLSCILALTASSCLLTACASVEIDKYADDSRVPEYNTYEEITVDGKVDDAAWANQNKFELSNPIAGVTHNITASSKYTEEGLLMYWSVLGSPAYYNEGRASYNNSSVGLYITSGTNVTTHGNAWEIDLGASGVYATRKSVGYHRFNDAGEPYIGWSYGTFAADMDFKASVDGTINDSSNNGYYVEYLIPWTMLDIDPANKPEYICVDVAINYVADQVSNREAWYSLAENNRPDYGWATPQGWYKFGSDGYINDLSYEKWYASSVNENIIISEDEADVTICGTGWNNGSTRVVNRNFFTGNSYQEVTIYKNSIANPDVAEFENVPGYDSGLGGLNITAVDGSGISFVAQQNKDAVYKLRFQDSPWTSIDMTDVQYELYSDENKGLRIGLLNIDTMVYAYADDGTGQMKLLLTYNTKDHNRGINYNATKKGGLLTNVDAKFTDYKAYYGSDLDSVAHVINDGEALAGGEVSIVGNIATGYAVEVYPDATHEIDTFKINGKDVLGGYASFIALEVPFLDIEVTFKEATLQKHNYDLVLNGAYNYSESEAVNGYVSFAGAINTFAKVVDGELSVDLADGEYTVDAAGYYPITITVNNGVVTEGNEINLVKKMFNDNANWTTAVNVNGGYDVFGSVTGGDNRDFLYLADLDISEENYANGVILSFNYKAEITSSSKYHLGFALFMANGNFEWLQFVQWGTSCVWKSIYPQTAIATLQNGAGTVELDCKLVINGNQIILLVKSGDVYVPAGNAFTADANITSVALINGNEYKTEGFIKPVEDWEEFSFTNFKIEDLASAPVEVTPNANAEITVDKTEIKYGGKVNISIVPNTVEEGEDPILVKSVTVNGVPVSYTVELGKVSATFTANDFYAEEYVINCVAEATAVNETTITFYGVNRDPATKAILANQAIRFAGLIEISTQLNNGVATVEIPDGEYIVKVDGYLNATITISGGEVVGYDDNVITLAKPIFVDNVAHAGGVDDGDFDVLTYSDEKGYYLSTKNSASYVGLANDINITNGIILDFTFSVNTTTATRMFPAFYVYGLSQSNELVRLEIQFCIWNGKTTFKNKPTGEEVSIFSSVGANSGEFRIVIEKNNNDQNFELKLYKANDFDNPVAVYEYATKGDNPPKLYSLSSIGIRYNHDVEPTAAEYWEMSNIKIQSIANA